MRFSRRLPADGRQGAPEQQETDSTKWNCNNLNSMFGNRGFLILVYVLPLILSDVRFLLLAAMIFYFANVYDGNLFVWSDFVAAIAWCVAVFWFSFRSPLYWRLGGLKGYKLSAQSAYGVTYARTH